jgi:hypothetical protein
VESDFEAQQLDVGTASLSTIRLSRDRKATIGQSFSYAKKTQTLRSLIQRFYLVSLEAGDDTDTPPIQIAVLTGSIPLYIVL